MYICIVLYKKNVVSDENDLFYTNVFIFMTEFEWFICWKLHRYDENNEQLENKATGLNGKKALKGTYELLIPIKHIALIRVELNTKKGYVSEWKWNWNVMLE